jgi:hypothetical protein
VTIDREAAAKYGIGVRELSPYVQLVTSGVKLGSYRPDDGGDELDIRVRLPEEERTFDALDSLRIVTAQGLVPVSNFIERKAVPKVANICPPQRRLCDDGGRQPELRPMLAGEAIAADAKIEEIKAWQATQADMAGKRQDRVWRRCRAGRRHQRLHRLGAVRGGCSLIFGSSCCSSTTASTRWSVTLTTVHDVDRPACCSAWWSPG